MPACKIGGWAVIALACGLAACSDKVEQRVSAAAASRPAEASQPAALAQAVDARACAIADPALRARLDDAVAAGIHDGEALSTTLAPLGDDCARFGRIVYGRYLVYLHESVKLPAAGTVATRIAALARLRSALFSLTERTALFAEDERYERYLLARALALGNTGLDEAGRRRALSAAEMQLSGAERAARAQTMAPSNWLRDEVAMRAAGVASAAIAAEREARFGAAAADRLEALETEQAAWRKRVDAFRRERAAILREEPDAQARAARLAALRERSFNPRERLRFDAYFDDEDG